MMKIPRISRSSKRRLPKPWYSKTKKKQEEQEEEEEQEQEKEEGSGPISGGPWRSG
jgi:hypothetical protein